MSLSGGDQFSFVSYSHASHVRVDWTSMDTYGKAYALGVELPPCVSSATLLELPRVRNPTLSPSSLPWRQACGSSTSRCRARAGEKKRWRRKYRRCAAVTSRRRTRGRLSARARRTSRAPRSTTLAMAGRPCAPTLTRVRDKASPPPHAVCGMRHVACIMRGMRGRCVDAVCGSHFSMPTIHPARLCAVSSLSTSSRRPSGCTRPSPPSWGTRLLHRARY